MPHHKHSATIIVVGVGGVVGELSASEGRLTHLFATLYLVVAKLAIVSTLGGVFLSARTGMIAPPSS